MNALRAQSALYYFCVTDDVYWMVPEVRRFVASEVTRMDSGGRVASHVREEITHYVMLK